MTHSHESPQEDQDYLNYLDSLEADVEQSAEVDVDLSVEQLDLLQAEIEEPAFEAATRESVEKAIFAVLSSALNTHRDVKAAKLLCNQVKANTIMFEVLDERIREPLRKSIDHALALMSDMEHGSVTMVELGLLEKVRVAGDTLKCLELISKTVPSANAEAELAQAINGARRYRSHGKSVSLAGLIKGGSAPADLRAAYKAVVSAPPVALDEGGVQAKNKTVKEMLIDANASAVSGAVTMSSGFASLDMNVSTRDGLDVGYVRSGQVVVFVAPTGSGKTSAFNTIVPAGVQDIANQNHRGKVLYVHIEEDTKDLFENMGIYAEGPYQHLQDKMVAVKTTSREDVVKLLYREIHEAHQRSVSEGLPISLLVPPAIFIDYFQALSSPMDGGSETTSASNTADLLLHGFANFDPEAMSKFGGISYEEFTGEAWPSGLEGTEMCVVTTAQLLLKGNSAQKPFVPETDDWRAYAAADSTDNPAWDLRAGDFPMAKLDDIRGSSKIVQHATLVIGLHRSRPRNNPGSETTPCGRFKSLQDTRGFFTILKARYGQRQTVVPMEFNLQRNGGQKAQYIDCYAEPLVDIGKILCDERIYKNSGDPIVPRRNRVSKMAEVIYF